MEECPARHPQCCILTMIFASSARMKMEHYFAVISANMLFTKNAWDKKQTLSRILGSVNCVVVDHLREECPARPR